MKCKASQKHSLGYLHTSFVQKISAKSLPERRFFCSCQALKAHKSTTSKDEVAQRCIHFFACICAFASDETLAQEFSDFLNFDSSGLKEVIVPQLGCHSESTVSACESPASKPKKRKKDELPGAQTNSSLLPQDAVSSNLRKSGLKKPVVASSLKRQACGQLLDEAQVTLSFQDWLASVTERIHQTMHYQFDGNTSPDQKEPTPSSLSGSQISFLNPRLVSCALNLSMVTTGMGTWRSTKTSGRRWTSPWNWPL